MRLLAFFFAAVLGLAVTTANARDYYKAGALDISDPWSRATPKGSSVAAGYMKIKNSENAADQRRLGNQAG
jgi:copper(I)-binding protein